ncbi:hypothetical protein [Cellulomonas olei]|uniref:hypothetical protein n=1 Tax=Cellulomonas sp. P4 TaxID=3142533 RepID=UPI0031BAC25E
MTTLDGVPTRTPPATLSTDLHIVSVLESGLPSRLATPEQPTAYVVPLVFSRQVSPSERARIEAPETARAIAEATGRTGTGLRLTVSDLRLLVEPTTLEELRDGLAAALAAMLRDLAGELRRASAEREVAAEAQTTRERQRADAVHATIASIRFE